MSGHRAETDRLLRSALAAAARVWHIFPFAPGAKVPALRGDWQVERRHNDDSLTVRHLAHGGGYGYPPAP